jgi:ribose-phosphate pyrophosphokinase
MSAPERIVIGFPEHAAQARALAARLGARCAIAGVHRFPDGESKVTLPTALPEHVVFCRSLDRPNDKLVELMLAAEAAAELGARRLTLVAPYLCYMRQDAAFRDGEAVSQRIVGRFLARYFDHLVTVDPHLHRTAALADALPTKQAVALTAAPLVGPLVRARLRAPLVIGPDLESSQWVEAVAQAADCPFGVGEKQRHGDHDVSVALPELHLEGREVVLVDDVASTGRTLAAAARACLVRRAASVSAVVTHALFFGDALDTVRQAGIAAVWSTDSVPHPTNAVALADLLAEAVRGLGD